MNDLINNEEEGEGEWDFGLKSKYTKSHEKN